MAAKGAVVIIVAFLATFRLATAAAAAAAFGATCRISDTTSIEPETTPESESSALIKPPAR